jgi:protocatechuate 3,4-dioxygenase beta subunit
VLSKVPEGRRATLIARPGVDRATLLWDIVVQGQDETVFFDY